jgi:hypothetical protein
VEGQLKIGDRVRLTDKKRSPDFRTGEVGTVIAIMPSTGIGAQALYQVRVDGGEYSLHPVFYADELEKLP